MILRRARQDDAQAITDIWNEIIRDTAFTFASEERTREDVARLITEREAFFVAEEADHCLGFATYAQFRNGSGYRQSVEHTIYLAPPARGKGVGRALLSALHDHARQAGMRVMVAGVSSENSGGVLFHLASGYVQVGHMPGVAQKFGRSMDLILLQKHLQRNTDIADEASVSVSPLTPDIR